ncbi:hypothetical protein PFISCL1PPCAC_21666, partial [Pristionchus fissidentatus]
APVWSAVSRSTLIPFSGMSDPLSLTFALHTARPLMSTSANMVDCGMTIRGRRRRARIHFIVENEVKIGDTDRL